MWHKLRLLARRRFRDKRQDITVADSQANQHDQQRRGAEHDAGAEHPADLPDIAIELVHGF